MDKSRRGFIKKATVGVLGATLASSFTEVSAKSYSRILGANDRIKVAIQGLGRRHGSYLPAILNPANNIELKYICDVLDSQCEKASKNISKKSKQKPKIEKDFRKILKDKDIDAVFLSTPDHWHAPGACMAMEAGKHVYVEKPCSHNLRENELIVAYQKKYNKVVQMGNQQRSSKESQQIIKDIHDGIIGDVYKAEAFYNNGRGEVPLQQKAPIPEGLDWDLYQGPAPRRDYTHNTWNYNWHWYGWDYGTAEAGNNGTHEIDIARWALNVEYPEFVDVFAGKYQHKKDGWEMYDTMEANFRFPEGKLIKWIGHSRNKNKLYGGGRGTFIFGSKGSVFINRGGYELFDLKGNSFKKEKSKVKEDGISLGGGGGQSTMHVVNFLDAIRGKKELNSPIEEAAKSVMLVHYANIASKINKSFEVDEKTGLILNKEALKLWSREYEPGWEIKSV